MPIEHHVLTHSIAFWIPIYGVLFAMYRKAVLPYFIATFSHFLIGDIQGSPPILLGITDARFSLPFTLEPLAKSLVEVSLFAALVAVGVNKKNFTIDLDLKKGKWDLVVLGAVTALIIAGNALVPGKVEDRTSDAAPTVIMAAGHVALLVLLVRSYWLTRAKPLGYVDSRES
jgi:hypothetical protein